MLFTIPAIIKVFSIFGLILILNRLKLHLSLCLCIGSLVLGIWMKQGPVALARTILTSLTSLQTIVLLLIVGSILIISKLMKQSGHMDRILEGFRNFSQDDRTAGALMPALIGLLPMPGGALFSAPMVETAFSNRPVSNESKTIVNYWFRHIWEYWWPLYPGVVLAVTLLEVDTWRFMAFMVPMTLVNVLAGIFFLLKPLGKRVHIEKKGVNWAMIGSFLWEIMPILIVVLLIMLASGLTGLLGLYGIEIKISGGYVILPGLVASLIWVSFVDHVSFRQLGSVVMNKGILPMLLLIAAVMVFKGIMLDSQAVIQIRNELVSYEIPLILVILIIPFLCGMITGIAIGFVGLSFPLIIPMFPNTSIFEYLSWASVSYAYGIIGMMLSPVHVCFLVTKDYFKVGLLNSYRHLMLPSLTVLLAAVIVYLIPRFI